MIAIASLVVIAISVYILAIITDEFFIVSLDEVSTKLEIPSDVAGASLMAMGSSAPELCIALLAVFLGGAHGDVGIGTIVGSAVFNILVITGASAIVGESLPIKQGSVERDIFFYLVSVVLLFVFFRDGSILIWEAGVMLAVYVGYLVLLWIWGKRTPDREPVPHKMIEKKSEEGGGLKAINRVIIKVFGFIARDPEEQFVWALVVSIAAIAGISYVLVEAALFFSAAINLPPVIVSLTVLAAGTSAPDLIASMDVASEGRGSMGVANAVGSNVFDVLIGLALPWMIVLLFLDPGVPVEVGTEGLITSVIILGATVVLLYIFLFTNRTFTRNEGIVLIVVYVIFVVYSVIDSGGAAAAG